MTSINRFTVSGAENALNATELADADRLWLTNSFRFGPAVAEVANALLREAGENGKSLAAVVKTVLLIRFRKMQSITV